jgi:predicted enzyme related to lactoylglutathione lyase
MHGQFVWYELTTPDVDGSIAFYPTFTKWGTMPFDANYTMWTNGGQPFAGIFRLTDEMRSHGVPPNWMPYVASDDVDATMERVKALGGTVVMPAADIPGTGRFGVAQDPQGATFGVYKPVRDQGGWDGNPVIGTMSWHELMTTDYPAARQFYGDLFGWVEIGTMDMGGSDGMYSMFGHGEAMYGGMFNRPAEMAGVTPFWMLYIHVKDVAKAVKQATKAGATIMRPQMDIPGGSIAILVDPQGAAFAVHQLAAEASKPAPAAKPVATAKKAVRRAKTAVGKALRKAAKAVKGAVAKVKAKARPAATKAKKAVSKGAPRKLAATRPAAKKAAGRKRARTEAKRVVKKAVKKVGKKAVRKVVKKVVKKAPRKVAKTRR